MSNATLQGLDVPTEREQGLRLIIRNQHIEEFVPALSKIAFAENGQIWVRVRGVADAAIHPSLAAFISQQARDPVRWDMLDQSRGYVRTVLMPATFDPLIFDGDHAFGFVTLASGEIAVARAYW